MLQIYHEGRWVQFYPIKYCDMAGEGDTLDTRALSEMEDEIYGKYVGGVSGYQPWWVYKTVSKNLLREV